MAKGNDGKERPGDTTEHSSTLEHNATVAAPTPMEVDATMASSPSPTESSPLADTAVATQSQAMAAVTAPDVEPVEDPLLGSVLLGRYEITGKIGQGGMGAVYEATHTLIGKRVAVKVLLDKYAQKDQVVARLEQEARLASSIGHEHIIDITDFGQTSDGRTFVVMEFLEGESLGSCLGREGAIAEQRTSEIGHQISCAVRVCLGQGVLIGSDRKRFDQNVAAMPGTLETGDTFFDVVHCILLAISLQSPCPKALLSARTVYVDLQPGSSSGA